MERTTSQATATMAKKDRQGNLKEMKDAKGIRLSSQVVPAANRLMMIKSRIIKMSLPTIMHWWRSSMMDSASKRVNWW